jgi:hypothetical protein
MFILYGLLAGLAAGLLLGGRVRGVGELRFRWSGVILAGLLAQVALFSDAAATRVGDLGPPLYVLSTLAVLAAVARNFRIPGIPLVVAGALCNLAAIIANGGYMPASPEALASLGRSVGTAYSNSTVLAAPALAPLTDVFAMPRGLPFANVFSVGDILIGAGVAIVIAVAMLRAAPPGMSITRTVVPGQLPPPS